MLVHHFRLMKLQHPDWEFSGSGHGITVDIGVGTYEAMTAYCGWSVVQVLQATKDGIP